MTSKLAIQEAKNALDKQDTSSNANFTDWDFEDAFNKGLDDWIRKQINGMNAKQEQEEESEMKVDDLQVLLVERKLSVTSGDVYADTTRIPENYRYFNKLTPIVTHSTCTKKTEIKSFFVENANVDDYLQDWTFSPSFDFEQTFHVMLSNKFRIFHAGDFEVKEVKLSYYRSPQKISTLRAHYDRPWEWKDDVARIIIDEAVKLLAGNIESSNAFQLAKQRVDETT